MGSRAPRWAAGLSRRRSCSWSLASCAGGVGAAFQAGDEVCGWSSQAGDGQPGSQAGGGIEQAALLCGRRGEAGPPREKSPSAASCARALFVEKN
ncbi:hypothetical protein GUJ93_ZPchr0007g3213 [Zizania palustris]|uniref:Uncharacterized protein n=1 Tax=Zizania palustris TaxID=103762 RepID=A0A8J5W4I0_ZIZPA|nr:hypothetical protein GUJ93_ZPchr0007g3213 [Zizania palustris]